MAQAIRSLKIYLILKKEYLDRRDWYEKTYLLKYKQQWPAGVAGKTLQTIEDHNVLTRDFNEVMLVSYTQILFSVVESKFRLFQMTLDSNALKGKSDAFYHVYTWLLPRVKKTQYQNLIRVFTYIRNTIHNNGKYMNTEHPYVPIEYRQKKYEFKHNEFVKYPNGVRPFSLLFLQITPDVIDMMEDIILNSELIKINSIPDPIYSQEPRPLLTYWPF
jgi:hypothetical protein